MKNIRFISAVAALIIVFSFFSSSSGSADYYPAAAVVTEITGDVVTLENYSGFLWQFSGAEDYAPGDLVALIIDDNGTVTGYDDIIVAARYCGVLYDWGDDAQS